MLVTWSAPDNLHGVAWYTATATGGNTEQHCEAQNGTLSCEVQSLKPYTDYTVELVACDKQLSQGKRICSNVVAWKHNPVRTLQTGKFVKMLHCYDQPSVEYVALGF